jgi:hypothetical protein
MGDQIETDDAAGADATNNNKTYSKTLIIVKKKNNSNKKKKKNKEQKNENNIKNKGTGAGGAQTNKNGLPYEELTSLISEYTIINKNYNSNEIVFNKHKNIKFIATKQSKFFKYMDSSINKNIPKGHGCKRPDECFIDEVKNIIFILEKKFQQVSGSVCEKIQTSDFKLWQYNRTFPKYKVVYIYCLSDWFKKNCKAELQYLKYKKIPVFWGSDKKYKKDIIDFIINYE